LYYEKYRNALEKNKEMLETSREIFEDPFERSLFVEKPGKEFEVFLKTLVETLRRIARKC